MVIKLSPFRPSGLELCGHGSASSLCSWGDRSLSRVNTDKRDISTTLNVFFLMAYHWYYRPMLPLYCFFLIIAHLYRISFLQIQNNSCTDSHLFFQHSFPAGRHHFALNILLHLQKQNKMFTQFHVSLLPVFANIAGLRVGNCLIYYWNVK